MTRGQERPRFLDRADAAVVFVDHQVGTVLFGIRDLDPVALVNDTVLLAEASRIFGLPAVLTSDNPAGAGGPVFGDLVAELPEAPVVVRTVTNAWHDPSFVDAVEATGRRQLIMVGVPSDACLPLTAIAAAGSGYDVHAVVDEPGDPVALSPNASLSRMSRAGVRFLDAGSVLVELLDDGPSPGAATVNELLARRHPRSRPVATGPGRS